MGNGLPVLRLNKFSLRRWFLKCKGTFRRTVVRPLLTEEHLQARVEYCDRVLGLIEQNKVIVYLDEKWFYITSRRKKSKHLPLGPFEPAGSDRIQPSRVIHRQHPVKTMFMGVITKPIPERNFDGKISILRLSRQVRLQRNTYRTNIHEDRGINEMIRNREWVELFEDDTYRVDEMIARIADYYNFPDGVETSLCFRYITHLGDDYSRKHYVNLRSNETIRGKKLVTRDGEDRTIALTLNRQ